MQPTTLVLALLSALVNTIGQLCGVGGRPFLQVLFQAVFTNSLRTSSEVIATALLVNTIAFSLGVPGYNSLGLYDARLVLDLATVEVPAAILGASAGSYVSDRTLRIAYSILASCTAGALTCRARRLITRQAILIPDKTSSQPEDSFSREGNFLSTDDVERINLLDESDFDESDNEDDTSRRFCSFYLPVARLANNQRDFFSVVSPPSLSSLMHSTVPDVRTLEGGESIISSVREAQGDPLTRMLTLSRSSISSVTNTAQSFISISASVTNNFELPTTASSLLPISTPRHTYGALSQSQEPPKWQLLDLALAQYNRPSLTTRSKATLAAGGLLCGALGVGAAESVLIVLVGLHNVPLVAAATAAISVAFYTQMTASVMDGVASAADAATPRIAESVPWSLVAALVPGVVIGALVGPRLHAFVCERRTLLVASATLFCVSVSVAVVGTKL